MQLLTGGQQPVTLKRIDRFTYMTREPACRITE